MRICQILRRQDAVEFRFAQQAAFEYDFAHAFAGLGADFADQIGKGVREVVLERGLLSEAELDRILSPENLANPHRGT